jgi:hypothetical protein
MSALVHRRFDAETAAERPPLRLLERRPRLAAAPVQEAPRAESWLVRWIDAYFSLGERLNHRHRLGSWQTLR